MHDAVQRSKAAVQGQLPADLEDEEVPPVAAYVSEPRGNEPKLFVTSSVPVTQSPVGDERYRIVVDPRQ